MHADLGVPPVAPLSASALWAHRHSPNHRIRRRAVLPGSLCVSLLREDPFVFGCVPEQALQASRVAQSKVAASLAGNEAEQEHTNAVCRVRVAAQSLIRRSVGVAPARMEHPDWLPPEASSQSLKHFRSRLFWTAAFQCVIRVGQVMLLRRITREAMRGSQRLYLWTAAFATYSRR